MENFDKLTNEDYRHAIELRPGIFWVGAKLEDDDFQCHPYLLVNGNESVLFDPGSMLTFSETFRKIESIIPFSKIRYFICHHQDPDITGALPLIDSLVSRSDAVIITHWRAIALLKHLGLKMPMQCVEKMGWKLELRSGQYLEFIFSPYLHFPGAFVSYKKTEKLLFSSDIFGAISAEFRLVAENESCFDGIRLFHEHYMPSREILLNFLDKLQNYEIEMILPQHGSILRGDLIRFVINRLRETECGIYTLAQTSTKIKKLSMLNRLLSDITKTIILSSNFNQIVVSLIDRSGEILEIEDLFAVSQDEDGEILVIGKDRDKADEYRNSCKVCHNFYGKTKNQWFDEYGRFTLRLDRIDRSNQEDSVRTGNYLIVPLFNLGEEMLIGLLYFSFRKETVIDAETESILNQLMPALSAALERELIKMHIDKEKNRFYQQSIKDSLTGLYSRFYMQEMVERYCKMQDRDGHFRLGMIYFDIDNFKKINDTYGHGTGDTVLQAVARILLDETRGDDLQVRLGGEEMAVLFLSSETEEFYKIGERIRKKISELDFSSNGISHSVTVSGGVAVRKVNEPAENVVNRADRNLYAAKNSGKNRIVADE